MGRLPVEAVCAGIAFLIYINTFTADFVYDDSRAVLKNLDVRTTTPIYNIILNDFWGTRMIHSGSHKSYRPITLLTFRLNYAISEFKPWSYHVTNVVLHSIATWLFVVFLKSEIFSGARWAQQKSTAAGLLFAVHPIHTEAVAGIVGRADVLSTIFVFATLLTYAKYCSCDEFQDSYTSEKLYKYPHKNKTLRQRMEKNNRNNKNQVVSKKFESNNHLRCISELHNMKETIVNSLKSAFVVDSFTHAQRRITSPVLVMTFAILAILSKENGFCALPLCAIYDVWIRNKIGIATVCRMIFCQSNDNHLQKVRRRVFILSTSTAIILCLRILPWSYLSTHTATPSFSTADNPASTNDCIITRTLTFFYLPVFNALLLICPAVLSYDWGAIPMIESIWDVRNLYTVVFYLLLTAFAKYIWRHLRLKDEQYERRYVGLFCDVNKSAKNIPKTACEDEKVKEDIFREDTDELFKALLTKQKSGRESVVDEGIHIPDSDSSFHKFCIQELYSLGEDCAKDVFHKLTCRTGLDLTNKHLRKSDSNLKNVLSCNLPESTNSSGYATESGEEGFDDYTECDRHQICKKFAKTEEIPIEALESHQPLYQSTSSKSNVNSEIILISFALMIIPFLPATNLFFYVGFVVAERLLYLPSIGFCILITEGGFKLYHKIYSNITNKNNAKRWKNAMLAFAILYLSVLSIRTVIRNEDWSSEFNLYRSGIASSPSKSWANLGNIFKIKGKIKEAESSYINALNERGNMADVHYNLGLLYQEQRRYTEALDRYKKAIQYRPTLAVAHLNTGIILAELGKFKEAEEVYRHIVEIDDTGLRDPIRHEKTKVSALYNLGCMLSSHENHEKALPVFLEAVKRRTPDYEPHSLYNMLGQSYFKLNKFEEAEKWFKSSLQSKPDHVPAHLTYALLLSKIGKMNEAEVLYKNAILIEPENHVVYNHFGKFFADRGLYHNAAKIMANAMMKKSGSSNYDTVMSSADYHRHVKDYAKSEKYYKMATKIKPEAAAGHVNLGAIMHLQKKYTEARKLYLMALSLQPGDPTAMKNLHKLDEIVGEEK